jgi:hypothetical protein
MQDGGISRNKAPFPLDQEPTAANDAIHYESLSNSLCLIPSMHNPCCAARVRFLAPKIKLSVTAAGRKERNKVRPFQAL